MYWNRYRLVPSSVHVRERGSVRERDDLFYPRAFPAGLCLHSIPEQLNSGSVGLRVGRGGVGGAVMSMSDMQIIHIIVPLARRISVFQGSRHANADC